MKIALVNNLYPPYQKGGAEKIVQLLVEEFAKEGKQTFIITGRPDSKNKEQESKRIHYLPSFYYRLEKLPKSIRLFWHIWDIFNIRNYLKFKKILRKEAPDLVITNNIKGLSGLIPLFLGKQKGIKHLHILHDIQLLHPSGLLIKGEEKKLSSVINKIYIKINSFLWGSPEAVISPSGWLLDIHQRYEFFPQSSKKVLPNPLILDKKNYDPEKQAPKQKFTFLYVGQIEEHKGVLFLAKSFKKYHKTSKLIIVGGGSLEEELKKTISDSFEINYLGKKDNQEVQKYMEKADCLIVPSLCYENSPTVIYEALQKNLPVLASNLGGIPETKKFGAVELFEAGDRKDLIRGAEKIKKNFNQLKIKAKKRKEGIKKLEVKKYIKELKRLSEN